MSNEAKTPEYNISEITARSRLLYEKCPACEGQAPLVENCPVCKDLQEQMKDWKLTKVGKKLWENFVAYRKQQIQTQRNQTR